MQNSVSARLSCWVSAESLKHLGHYHSQVRSAGRELDITTLGVQTRLQHV